MTFRSHSQRILKTNTFALTPSLFFDYSGLTEIDYKRYEDREAVLILYEYIVSVSHFTEYQSLATALMKNHLNVQSVDDIFLNSKE